MTVNRYLKNFSRIEFTEKRKGVYVKSLTGNNSQIILIRLDPGVQISHGHPEEQLGYILSGTVELGIGDEKNICTTGTAYFIPGDTPHSFKLLGVDPLEYLEIFSPPKEENRL